MKIIRIRRGFTTNSSGANEFLPDGGIRPKVVSDAGAPSAPAVLTSVQSWGEAPSATVPVSNTTAIGVASLVVAGAFLVVPAIRLIRKKKSKKEDDSDADET